MIVGTSFIFFIILVSGVRNNIRSFFFFFFFEVPIQVFYRVFCWVASLFRIGAKASLYSLAISPLFICVTNIFLCLTVSFSLWCLLINIHLILRRSNWSVFSFIAFTFYVLRNSFYTNNKDILSPLESSITFFCLLHLGLQSNWNWRRTIYLKSWFLIIDLKFPL